MQNVRRRTRAPGSTAPSPDEARPRGRPRAFDRDAALDAAMRLFWQKGFAATSISDLTAAMGINSPSLYAAFGCKEQLYAEALRRFTETAAPQIWASLDGDGTARDAVEAFLLGAAAALPAAPDRPAGCMVTLSAAGAEGNACLGDLVCAARAEAVGRLRRRLSRAREERELPDDTDVDALARFIAAVHQGMSVQARDGAGRAELETIARSAMRAWPAG